MKLVVDTDFHICKRYSNRRTFTQSKKDACLLTDKSLRDFLNFHWRFTFLSSTLPRPLTSRKYIIFAEVMFMRHETRIFARECSPTTQGLTNRCPPIIKITTWFYANVYYFHVVMCSGVNSDFAIGREKKLLLAEFFDCNRGLCLYYSCNIVWNDMTVSKTWINEKSLKFLYLFLEPITPDLEWK